MEQSLSELAEYIALIIEAIAIAIVAFGAIEGFARLFEPLFHWPPHVGWRKSIWVGFGMWLLLGLQFALAADIVRSVISPTWETLGQLAAIAGIRAFLNYFLEKDMEEMKEARSTPDRERIEA
jgi:uncharacterized membrane protein